MHLSHHGDGRHERSLLVPAVAVLGVACIVTGAVLWTTNTRLPRGFSAAPGTPTVSARPSVTATAATASSTPPPPPVTTAPASFVPTTVHLAAFDVDAAVTPVLTAGGVLAPPDDPRTVGWWMASVPAGSAAGTTVLVGHVDGPAGPGALYRLVHSRPGDVVTVGDAAGTAVSYRVDGLQYVPKTSTLPTSLFTSGGAPRLVVISCGGTFDRATSEYADNVVVTAQPV